MKTYTSIATFAMAMLASFSVNGQLTGSWQLWASGLQPGTYPKVNIAPNHDIYYGLTATGGTKGIIYKANTQTATGTFAAMPTITVPVSIQNNIQYIQCNQNNEPIVGVFRNDGSEPCMYRWNSGTNAWVACNVANPPALGVFGMARSSDGTIWMGAKWSNVYKSTDGGQSFVAIDESTIAGAAYPCYYPSWSGNAMDGAIYSINVDANDRVYVGTEGAGILFSDDAGVTWHPADLEACDVNDDTQKNANSPMKPMSNTGNLGAIGFTANNEVVFNGTNMWAINWKQMLGVGDMVNHTCTEAQGFLDYFFSGGLQVTKIVTTTNGHIFLHSGNNASVADTVGIYHSTDGIHWEVFNTGITSVNNGQSSGSLAVDGTKVFTATADGKIWMYDTAPAGSASLSEKETVSFKVAPNPASDFVEIESTASAEAEIINGTGKVVLKVQLEEGPNTLQVSQFQPGVYFLRTAFTTEKLVIQK